MRTISRWALGIAVLVLGAVGAIWALNVQDETDVRTTAAFAPTDSLIARGAYLARAGNCMACHTARGGASYAGGLGIPTPFGTVLTLPLDCVSHNRAHELACLASHSLSNCIGLT